MHEDFYRAFEDKYRGSREIIKKRLEVYLPFILPLNKIYPNSISIDIGCGRGEWLELLGDNNLKVKGVDSDKGMLDGAKERGLDITLGDGIEYLSKQESNSAVVISAFHLVEHLSFDNLMKLVKEANRVLVDGGILILETPNPENIKVASETFYLDPTHIKPIPYGLLSFISEYCGYKREKRLRLQEDRTLHNNLYVNVGQVIEAVSPDYAIISQKKSIDKAIFHSIDVPFAKEYGIAPVDLVRKFEARIDYFENHINSLQDTIRQQETCIDKTILLVKIAQDSANNAQVKANTAQDGVDHTLKVANTAQTSANTAQNGVNYIIPIIKNNQKKSIIWRTINFIKNIKQFFKKKSQTITNTSKIDSIDKKQINKVKDLNLKDSKISPYVTKIYEELKK